jgi:hypothetical protein
VATLSQEIVNGHNAKAAQLIKSGIDLNYLDEYGFTPLTQAAIMDNYALAALMLNYKADPNKLSQDRSTALQWAVDNSNYDLTELLLKNKADPNIATPENQPLLFYPTLRKDKPLCNLLIQYGAKENVVKDYILAKLIGHRFELQGYIEVINADGVFVQIDFEGFYLEFTISLILESLDRFMKSYEANRLNLPIDEYREVQLALKNAYELRSFRHINKNIDDYLPRIKQIIRTYPLLLIPVSFRGHAMSFIRYQNLFARCDRGVHKMTDPIMIYEFKNDAPLTIDFYKQLMYEKNPPNFINKEVNQILGLKKIDTLPISHQKSGNCSWANIESSVPTMLYMLLYKDKSNKNPSKTQQYIMQFYQAWKEWDKDRALEDLIVDIKDKNKPRRISKALLLAAVLNQSCDYKNPRDIVRAKKILTILSEPEYKFILRTYIEVYIKKGSGELKQRFERLLEVCDVDYKIFI